MLRGRIALQIQVPLRLLCNIWHDTVHETLMSPPVYIANKGLTEMLNPLEATLTKNRGEGSFRTLRLLNRHLSSRLTL